MTDSIRERAQSFAKFMTTLPPEEIARVNELHRKEAAEQHKQFSSAFKAGRCSFCDNALTAFDPAEPCRHWLLKPEGARKEHIEQVAIQFSWSILENYLRWVANEEAFAKNINDLADEGTGKLLELTIKYKNLEWSFSCGESDLDGHEGGGEHSRRPHWHFQMYVDGKPFIRYNDFHIPLSEADAGFLEFMRVNPGKVFRRLAGGEGMNQLLDESMFDHLVTMARSRTTDDEVESAPIKFDTIIMAPPGKTIRGEDIYNLVQQAKAEGVTATSKMREPEGVSVQTFVSPGPGVVDPGVIGTSAPDDVKVNRSMIAAGRPSPISWTSEASWRSWSVVERGNVCKCQLGRAGILWRSFWVFFDAECKRTSHATSLKRSKRSARRSRSGRSLSRFGKWIISPFNRLRASSIGPSFWISSRSDT